MIIFCLNFLTKRQDGITVLSSKEDWFHCNVAGKNWYWWKRKGKYISKGNVIWSLSWSRSQIESHIKIQLVSDFHAVEGSDHSTCVWELILSTNCSDAK